MRQHKIELIMTPECRDKMAAIIGDHILTKIGVPLLNLLNSMEERAVPMPDADATPRSKRVSGGAA